MWWLKQGMGNGRLEMTELETSCIYSQFSFVKIKIKMRSLSLCVFLCECFVRVESWDIFLASFWKLLRAITIIGTALLRLFINPCPSIYLFLIFFLYTCKWICLDFYCAYLFNLLFMDLFYLLFVFDMLS